MNNDIAIKVENLSKVYPLRQPYTDENGQLISEHWALKDVSIEIKKGESVGIIGPNGSGKSTLLKILAGVTKPSSGKVTIQGKVASILDIGAGFHPELSGRENVYLNGQIHGFSKKEIEEKFDEIVAFSGIEKFIDEPVKNYSNGMYLRLAFSIMANLDFDVYLLDEVINVGDFDFNLKSKEIILKLRNESKTLLIASHNHFEIKESILFYLFFRNGRVEITQTEHLFLKLNSDLSLIFKNTINYEDVFIKTDFVFVHPNRDSIILERSLPIKIGVKFQSKTNLSEELEFAFRLKRDGNSFYIHYVKAKCNYKVDDLLESGFTLPANFLNDGFYQVDFFIGTIEVQLYALFNCLAFQVRNDNTRTRKVIEPIIIEEVLQ